MRYVWFEVKTKMQPDAVFSNAVDCWWMCCG
jgi:hypothetical protein